MRILLINSVCGVKSTGRICTDLAEVAERCGFSDGKYFSTVFKKLRGCPPSIMRTNLSGDPSSNRSERS